MKLSTFFSNFDIFLVDPGDYEAVQDQAPGLKEIDWNVGLIIAALAGKCSISMDDMGDKEETL